jgi:CheY-like chemotaxis protein
MTTARVLYVDDEASNLIVFKAQFKKSMEIWTASSGAEALDILDQREIPVVLSDQKMPGMSGAELLAEVRVRHPHAVRMIVTAYTDFDQVVRSINESHVERYITKPWNPAELLSIVSSACELYDKAKENRSLTEDLLHKERLAAIGAVTLGLVRELETIGHRFRGLEGVETRPEAEARAQLDLFHGGIHELTAVLRGMRLFSKRGQQEQPLISREDLNAIAARSSQIIRLFPVARREGTFDFQPGPTPLMVETDPERIRQIVVNLALHLFTGAEPESASLKLETRAEDDSAILSLRGLPVPDAVEQKPAGFWFLLAHKVIGELGGELRADDRTLEVKLPLQA